MMEWRILKVDTDLQENCELLGRDDCYADYADETDGYADETDENAPGQSCDTAECQDSLEDFFGNMDNDGTGGFVKQGR